MVTSKPEIISKTKKILTQVKLDFEKSDNIGSKLEHISDNFTSYSENAEKLKKEILKISSWNLNSINARIKTSHFDSFFKNGYYDIVCFNETKLSLQKFEKDKYSTNNKWKSDYHQFWTFSAIKKGYSGVAILTKLMPINVKYGLDIPEFDVEGRMVTLEFDNFYLIAVYTPNSGDGLKRLNERVDKWEKAFSNYLTNLMSSSKKSVLILGDLNVAPENNDCANWKTSSKIAGFTNEERDCFRSLIDKGFVDSWRLEHPDKVSYTFWDARSRARDKNIGWRIDHMLVDKINSWRVSKTNHLNEILGSDHCPIELEFNNKNI